MHGRTRSELALDAARLALGAVLLAACPAASAESFDNDAVIALTQAKVGDAAVIAKIDSLPCGYDTSVGQLARLRQAGVSSTVLAAMIRRCPDDRSQDDPTFDGEARRPGIYLWRPQEKLARLEPAYVSAAQAGGNGSWLFPSRSKLSLAGASAATDAALGRPTFYFFFAADDLSRDGFGNAPSEGALDPAGFSLVRLEVAENRREIAIDKVTATSSTAGVDPKRTLALMVSEAGDRAFRVQVKDSLSAGQYAFIERLNGGSYRVYDFTVN